MKLPLLFISILFIFNFSLHVDAKTVEGKNSKTMPVKLYFSDDSCKSLKEVSRQMLLTQRPADQALRLLFAGPNETEKKLGLTQSFTPAYWFPKGTQNLEKYYIGVSIRKGVAIVNFRPGAMAYLNNTVCVQFSVKGPIEKTLIQFPSIKEVQFAIDGKVVKEWDA